MTETNFEIELRKRGRRRLIGAVVLAILSLSALPFLIKDAPPMINQSLIVNIIDPKIPEGAFKTEPLASRSQIQTIPDVHEIETQSTDTIPTITSSAKIFVQSEPIHKSAKLDEIFQKLDKANIKYSKSEFVSGGKSLTTINFGSFENNEEVKKLVRIIKPIVGKIKTSSQ